jgi:hypothetical protein
MNAMGDANEIPNRSEAETGVRVIEELYKRFPKVSA